MLCRFASWDVKEACAGWLRALTMVSRKRKGVPGRSTLPLDYRHPQSFASKANRHGQGGAPSWSFQQLGFR